jgi:radical SAM protein with 4Fe4S-binding SPASM domain
MGHPLKSPDLSFSNLDFSVAPFLLIWELTQACDLVCRHCRASAMPERCSGELNTEEGYRLLEQVKAMGTPVVVLSGGDPLMRPDLFDLVRHGLAQIAFSLDASTESLHDGFRQVPGTYRTTMQAVEWSHQAGLPVQINTTYSRYNLSDLESMIELVNRLGIVFWEVFILVPIGRGKELEGISAEECEKLLETLYECSRRASFLLKVTEAPHYRRIILQHGDSAGHPMAEGDGGSAIPAQLAGGRGTKESFGRKAKGINSGKGFCFVSHTGDVYPSGFLPLSPGNVRTASLVAMYRDSEIFRMLRDPDQLKGRCGRCEFREVCGGSRSRALAMTGDVMGEDPVCLYQPD